MRAGLDAYRYPLVACDVYLPAAGDRGCGGGLAALDGRSGHELWRLYVTHELFALNCRLDLDADGVWDCVAGGRMADLLCRAITYGAEDPGTAANRRHGRQH
ncbi:hypothetical protein MTO96_030325 [Rhipicephalus appendiculatus]